MEITEFRTKIADLEARHTKIKKEYDRQQFQYESSLKELEKLKVDKPEDLPAKIEELEKKIITSKAKLATYLDKFETKLKSIEDVMDNE